MKNKVSSVDYKRWEKVTLISQLLIAGFVLVTEVVNNALLYITRTQGYGPDTIVEKLLRYLVMTTFINFGLIIVSQLLLKIESRNKKEPDYVYRRVVMMLATVLICTDVAFSHYQFADTLAIFVVPVMISILYEDILFSKVTMVLSLAGMTCAIVARASDNEYNHDIGPEAAIALSLLATAYVFARVIMKMLCERRVKLVNAMAETEQMEAAKERAQLSLKTFETLARALDAKDKYTNGHAVRVAAYSIILAKELGYSNEELEKLEYEALLHDIGKIGVPDSVLNKPDRLTDVEFNIIKSHTVVGADILKDMIAAPEARDVALHHHERFDGRGYPQGIGGDEISTNARIVCIADTYDAMSSDRIYRKALPREVIREELVKGRGTQFDPEMLDVFLELFDNYKLRAEKVTNDKSDYDHIKTYTREDIDAALYNVAKRENEDHSIMLERYMRNIGLRYNQNIRIICFIINKGNDETNISENPMPIDTIMERCAKKCIRNSDIYYRFSDTEHYVILLNTDESVSELIAQRIIFEFNESECCKAYNISYEVKESNKYEK